MAEHRVELVELLDARAAAVRFSVELPSPFLPRRLQPRDLDHQLFALRQELVQRRIDGPDGDRLRRASP